MAPTQSVTKSATKAPTKAPVKRGRKRKMDRNFFQRTEGSTPIKEARRPNPLPPQYNFTPTTDLLHPQTPQEQDHVFPRPSPSGAPQIRNYPPPQTLFQTSVNQQRQTQQPLSSEEVQNNPRQSPADPPLQDAPPSPADNSQAQSRPSSHGNNYHEGSEASNPELQEDTIVTLNALLRVPNREKFTTVLSPTPMPKTTWFTRDEKSRLKTHTWDPLITGTVQQFFELICQRRMKDMICNAKTSGERPKWIRDTIWQTMVDYWETEEAQQRSLTYSKARMSDRGGLGPHVHLSGPKSYQQIHTEMERELGRPVSLGEVFIKTHTKPDGTYVDRKAEQISLNYEKNLQQKLSDLGEHTSQPPELTADDYTNIFIQSTQKDSRGNLYGVGSLKHTLQPLLNGKENQQQESAMFQSLQEQMRETQRQIEEQAAYNSRRDAEVAARDAELAAREALHFQAVAEQKDKLEHLSLVEKYLRNTDPAFIEFMKTQSAEATTEPLSTTLPATAPPSNPVPSPSSNSDAF
ncbi:PREDICTED: uncharacterized protein LOC109133068 [Camelina sativa]|uniref:Uncharacterized protein LOC109133068 n=1 Tax=Camelina sativa TaxID=90675 RepID=A0ABM1RQK6_CAMSA|nr:PREDICTED: uncharacterized protein LOC109133068 [Camelina sativa]